jgi:hypothetical protein
VSRQIVAAPAPGALPANRPFSDEFLVLRAHALALLEPYYDGEHLARAGEWLLAIEPAASEPLVLAALLHDVERLVPGGPVLDKSRQPWDDPDYNRQHCERSAAVAAGWLMGKGASERFVQGALPIREHEFGGSHEGDLLQAADSLSWLEVNARLAAEWVERGECDLDKARAKLFWMAGRVRLARERATANAYLSGALAQLRESAA